MTLQQQNNNIITIDIRKFEYFSLKLHNNINN